MQSSYGKLFVKCSIKDIKFEYKTTSDHLNKRDTLLRKTLFQSCSLVITVLTSVGKLLRKCNKSLFTYYSNEK